jgi:hypothetical protein
VPNGGFVSIDEDDFEVIPVFSDVGGIGSAKRAFGPDKLLALIADLNAAIAA